ncbi:MAG: CoA transferase, partial [Chloroflexi bacterium]|nr:CoA transferase [Chloroflexota bacterium]
MTLPPAAPPPGPLDGIRVLDASTGVAGPMAAMYLADFGADVVKLEPPGGDPARSRPGFAMWNRNKRGIVIDPADPAGRARRDAFLRGADVCLFSETLDALSQRGLDPESVRARNGRLVYLHMPPFLPDATPWAGGGESAAMIEAGTGVAMGQLSFEPVPVDLVAPFVLYSQAVWGATAAVAALAEREASGAGQTVGVGGLHGMLQAMPYSLVLIPGARFEPRASGPGGPVPHYRLYECSDGRWFFLAALTPAFLLPVLDLLGLMHVLADERLEGDPMAMGLPQNVAWAIGLLREAFLQRPRDEWLRLLAEIGCPAGPVEDRDNWLDHPQVRTIGMRAELHDPERGRVVMPGLPLHLAQSPASIRTP